MATSTCKASFLKEKASLSKQMKIFFSMWIFIIFYNCRVNRKKYKQIIVCKICNSMSAGRWKLKKKKSSYNWFNYNCYHYLFSKKYFNFMYRDIFLSITCQKMIKIIKSFNGKKIHIKKLKFKLKMLNCFVFDCLWL